MVSYNYVSDQQITDLSYLREVAMGDEDIVLETTNTFLENAPEALDQIEKAYNNQEWQTLYKQAHKIKPNLQYMGMDRARKLILEIEEQAKSENISDDLGEKVTEFISICSKGLDELSEKVKELPAQ